jgi:hypothetical protein
VTKRHDLALIFTCRHRNPAERSCFVAVAAILALLTTACDPAAHHSSTQRPPDPVRSTTSPPEKVLFLGNSLTYFHGGIEQHLLQLATSADPPIVLEVGRIASPNQNLMGHFRDPATNDALHAQNWDMVVLQGASGEAVQPEAKASFEQHARLFDRRIRATGAEPVFFMTWRYRFRPGMSGSLHSAYVELGNELNATVVPVGLAWDRVLEHRSGFFLYEDTKHPTLNGTYLAACVFYATLFGRSPEDSRYTAGIPKADANYLKRVAWETTRDFFAGQSQDR